MYYIVLYYIEKFIALNINLNYLCRILPYSTEAHKKEM